MVEVRVDAEICAASGMCTLLVPAVFDQSEEDGTVVLTDPAPPVELTAKVRTAALRCPAGAITVRETETDAPGA
ncbi:ferredoxin [Streptomyces albofaciens JCM 4342]|uniref:ferredoxin n=1 Tax=Streptomyces albofaciens TaxID=66866 RepID=UPI0012389E9D|nr:ferredoxin [Streptomyces albofaciens]KAA6212960.1 ferredoxin [Streptomyces albofaciens JCM 4342]